MNGKCIEITVYGMIEEGYFLNNKLTGFGRRIEDDGTIFQGKFDTGVLNGNAEMIQVNGKTYKVNWYKGKRPGKGKLFDPVNG